VTEQDAAPAGGRRTLLPHPGGAGAPPGGQYGLPARSLADGGCHARWPPQSAARRCKEDVRDGAPGGARILERECGITRTMVAPPGAPSPSYLRGTEEGLRRTRRRKETGRRSIGCLKSESVRWTESVQQSPLIPAKAGIQSNIQGGAIGSWVPAFAGTNGYFVGRPYPIALARSDDPINCRARPANSHGPSHIALCRFPCLRSRPFCPERLHGS
jgi:hypothetical protein